MNVGPRGHFMKLSVLATVLGLFASLSLTAAAPASITVPVNVRPTWTPRRAGEEAPDDVTMFGVQGWVDYGEGGPPSRRSVDVPTATTPRPSAMQDANNYQPIRINVSEGIGGKKK